MARNWFTKPDLKLDILSPILQLKQSQAEWQAKLSSSLPKGKDFDDLTAKINDPALLRDTTKANVAAVIKRLEEEQPHIDLPDQARKAVDEVGDMIKRLNSRRASTSLQRAGSRIHNVLAGLSAFLDSFSGLAEVMKGADQQFGGLAFGMVSLLVSFSAHKQMREEAVDQAISEIALALPRLERLQSLEPDEYLRPRIVDVFALVVLFCRETVDYCSSRAVRTKATFKPKDMKLETLAHLRISLLEVRKEIDMFLLKKMVVMEQLLRDIHVNTTSIMAEARHRDRQNLIDGLGRTLKIVPDQDGVFVHTDPGRYQAKLNTGLYQSAAYYRRKKIGRPRPATWAVFQEDAVFSQWLSDRDVCLMIAAGSNWVGADTSHLSWVSHASVLLAKRAHLKDAPPLGDDSEAPQHVVLHLFCNYDLTAGSRRKCTFATVCEYLVYQLIEQQPDSLMSKQRLIEDTVSSDRWTGNDPQVAVPTMINLLRLLLAELAAGTHIMLVIDRLDHCSWNSRDEVEDAGDMLTFALKSLLDLLRHESLRHLVLKSFIVLEEALAWRVKKHMPTLPGCGLAWRLDWRQERDRSFE